MPAVELKNLRKSFGDNLIVKGVDLAVDPSEFLVMVGPSGCGQTTLLRLIAGLEHADAGDIFIEGRRVNDVAPRDRDVAMVFQSYALYPHLTVRENLAFSLTLRKASKASVDARVQEVAAMLEVSEFLERKPKALSGGQRQRVAMGRAIVRQPKVFLFDEPLSNLDTALRVQMRGELARLHQRIRTTMIYVTHDQVEAMTLATRVAVFNKGMLQQVGAPLELYNHPANQFVAQFLGSPAMNVLDVQRDGGVLRGDGFELSAPADLQGLGALGVCLRQPELHVADQCPLSGTVDAVERLGFDGFAFVRMNQVLLAARFEGDQQVKVGDTVRLAPLGDSLHVFSADGSSAVRAPPRSPGA